MVLSDEQIKENLSLSIEVVLMRRGGPEFQMVLAKLRNNFNLDIINCYEKPEYLRKVLKEVYREDYKSVLEEIIWELGEYTQIQKIIDFLDNLK